MSVKRANEIYYLSAIFLLSKKEIKCKPCEDLKKLTALGAIASAVIKKVLDLATQQSLVLINLAQTHKESFKMIMGKIRTQNRVVLSVVLEAEEQGKETHADSRRISTSQNLFNALQYRIINQNILPRIVLKILIFAKP